MIAAQQGWPTPVFHEKPETDANYEACTRFLVENHEPCIRRLAATTFAAWPTPLPCAREAGLPAGRHEVQMLYGMVDPSSKPLVDMGERVRIYTPYGQLLPGMAYPCAGFSKTRPMSPFARQFRASTSRNNSS